MRVLQLSSDWKWTGSAEPMLVLNRALRARGHRVDLVCAEPPSPDRRSLAGEARARGLAPVEALEAERGSVRPGDGVRVRRLRERLLAGAEGAPYEVVHCWHSRDHVLAARALGRLPGSPRSGRTAIVRSLPHARRLRSWPWQRWLFGPACDGLLCVSEESARVNRRVRGPGPLASLLGAVELERLIPAADPPATRRSLGVEESDLLIGVVARIQAHRRFDQLLEAFARLVASQPAARLVLIGRGTQIEWVAREPARRLGIEERVVFAGYRVEDYSAVLSCMDLVTFLSPGSDGSCRALLEAAALGRPVVGARQGAIVEIVRDGITGRIVSGSAEELAEIWSTLLADPAGREAMGKAAAEDARRRFAPELQAERVEAFYREACSWTPISSR